MPDDLPPWAAVYQQAQRWLQAGCFEEFAHDLRAVLRWAAGHSDLRAIRSSFHAGIVRRTDVIQRDHSLLPN